MEPNTVITMGMDLGSAILVRTRHNSLLCVSRDGDEEDWGKEIERNGTLYQPALLPEAMETILNLPSEAGSFNSSAQLLAELERFLQTYLGCPEEDALLIAAWVMATHVRDALPHFPTLLVHAGCVEAAAAREVVGSLVRHSLPMGNPSIRDLLALPSDTRATVILDEPTRSSLEQFARKVAGRAGTLHHGEWIVPEASILVTTSSPVLKGDLEINLQERSSQRYDRTEMRNAAQELQRSLLCYRLKRYHAVANSMFDVQLAPQLRSAGQALGSALTGASEEQSRLVEILSGICRQDVSRGYSEETAVLDGILTIAHEGQATAGVSDVAELANAALWARGERQKLTSRKVGECLRKRFGLKTHRRGGGYEVKLSLVIEEYLHRLAGDGTSEIFLESCALCCKYQVAETQSPEAQELPEVEVSE